MNILFILTDDQGAWALNCAGTKSLRTPNIDSLAQTGTRFDNFFCASPVCSPARASILTGRMPSAHGIHDWLRSGNLDRDLIVNNGPSNTNDVFANEDKPIQYLRGQVCYTDLLAEKGYNCALSGKWHLGDSVNPQHGFNRWYTIGRGGCNYNNPDMVENGKVKYEKGSYVTDLITDRALVFLDEMAGNKKPFYLSVHYTAPHSPWEADQHPSGLIAEYDKSDFLDVPYAPPHPWSVETAGAAMSRHDRLRGYFAAITAMDAGVGRLLKALDDKGLREDTLVIFTSDNGMNMGHHGIWGKGNGTFPQNMYDTSVKVPFIASYPSMIPGAKVCSEMVSAYDIFPTMIDLLNLDKSACTGLPGKSFLPLLTGNRAQGNVALGGVSQDCVSQSGDERDVIIFDEYGPVRMIRTPYWKYVHRYPYGPNELYDLKNDPGEEKNLAADKTHSALIREMRNRMENWFLRYSDPRVDGTREEVTGYGQLCSAGVYAQKPVKYFPGK
ncbi:MAG: sulfatase-like hydrolase/transferase [Treponema sp.]|nr:sulfatase-like hydrolase/transferase [Treponema sp.]